MGNPRPEPSEEERAELAAEGVALPDGSYPMRDCDEVGRRLAEYSSAPDSHRDQLAALIRARDADLDCYHDLSPLEGDDGNEPADNETG